MCRRILNIWLHSVDKGKHWGSCVPRTQNDIASGKTGGAQEGESSSARPKRQVYVREANNEKASGDLPANPTYR